MSVNENQELSSVSTEKLAAEADGQSGLLPCPFCDVSPAAPYKNNVGEVYAHFTHDWGCFFSRDQWLSGDDFAQWNTRNTQPTSAVSGNSVDQVESSLLHESKVSESFEPSSLPAAELPDAEQLAYELIADLNSILPPGAMDGYVKAVRMKIQERVTKEINLARVHPRSKGGEAANTDAQLADDAAWIYSKAQTASRDLAVARIKERLITITRYRTPKIESEAAWRPLLKHVLICSGSPDDCEHCNEAQEIAYAPIASEISDEKRAELRARFIRPAHECNETFAEAKLLAGTDESPSRCSKCLKYGVVNNVCLECGKDERMLYGDFEREMTAEEWERIKVNMQPQRRSPLPLPPQSTQE